MPRPSPQSEHNLGSSPRLNAERPDNALHKHPTNYAQRLELSTSSSAPALPSFEALTQHGVPRAWAVVSGDPESPVQHRSLAIHTLLNPPGDRGIAKVTPQVSLSPGESVSTDSSYQTLDTSPHRRKRKEHVSPGHALQTSLDTRQGRQRLTQKPPSLRFSSQGVRGSPSADWTTSHPHYHSRVYTTEQDDVSTGHIPPLSFSLPGMRSYGPEAPHHESIPDTGPGSHTTSTISYTANDQGYLRSPSSAFNSADRENTSLSRPGQSDLGHATASHQEVDTAHDARVCGLSKASSARQAVYHMQFPTDQGSAAIPVEIDLQQASKSADEKRKRNAGASARFRQRRKEKEQASSAQIKDLHSQLENVTQQRDHYRSERDFYRGVLAGTRLDQQMPRRPSSPQARSSGGEMMTIAPESLPRIASSRREMTGPVQRQYTNDHQPSLTTGQMTATTRPVFCSAWSMA